jgi:hypothetical protein
MSITEYRDKSVKKTNLQISLQATVVSNQLWTEQLKYYQKF